MFRSKWTATNSPVPFDRRASFLCPLFQTGRSRLSAWDTPRLGLIGKQEILIFRAIYTHMHQCFPDLSCRSSLKSIRIETNSTWLVVSKHFLFHNIWDNPSHWLLYFSRWLKPPTRYIHVSGRGHNGNVFWKSPQTKSISSPTIRPSAHVSAWAKRFNGWWPS